MGPQRPPTSTPGDHQSLLQQISSRMSSAEVTGALWDPGVWIPDVGTHKVAGLVSSCLSTRAECECPRDILKLVLCFVVSASTPLPWEYRAAAMLLFPTCSCGHLCIRTPPTQCLMCESCVASTALCTLIFTAFLHKNTDHVLRHG